MGYATKGGSSTQKVTLPDLDVDTGTVITGGVIIVVLGAGIIYAIPWLIDRITDQLITEPWSQAGGWWENQKCGLATLITGRDESECWD